MKNIVIGLCKIIIIAFLLCLSTITYGQKLNVTPDISFGLQSNSSTGNKLPFWMNSNKNGIYSTSGSYFQLLQLEVCKDLSLSPKTDWDVTYGFKVDYVIGKKNNFLLNQYWLGTRYKFLELHIGAKERPTEYSGLSSTNGDLIYSNNSRPIPGIHFNSAGYIPFFFFKDRVKFKFVYEEMLMDNKRVVKDIRLHHKNLYFKIDISKTTDIEFGVDHWVQWGGRTDSAGDFPHGFTDYLRYITGMSGDEDFNLGEQNYVAGNHIGNYHVRLNKRFSNLNVSFYWNHLFDDGSGRKMNNLKDGLWGIYVERKKQNSFLKAFLYEFMNTKDQSGSYWYFDPDHDTGGGKDDYFNHYLYKSGWVNNGRMIGSPLFVPSIDDSGVSQGFESTRMLMHHFGLLGYLRSNFKWKCLFTYSQNYGTYDQPYGSNLNQCSYLLDFQFADKFLPFDINLGVAGDFGDRFENKVGVYLGLIKSL